MQVGGGNFRTSLAEKKRAFSSCSFKVFSHVIGLKSAFEVVLSPVMHKPDMEHQASLPRRLSQVVMEFKSIYHQAAPDTLNDKPLIQAIP